MKNKALSDHSFLPANLQHENMNTPQDDVIPDYHTLFKWMATMTSMLGLKFNNNQLDSLSFDPDAVLDDRRVVWLHSMTENMGKSKLATALEKFCYGLIIAADKISDAKFMVAQAWNPAKDAEGNELELTEWQENFRKRPIYIIDLPRTNPYFPAPRMINGKLVAANKAPKADLCNMIESMMTSFVSGKYSGGYVSYKDAPPTFLVLSNSAPEPGHLSANRLRGSVFSINAMTTELYVDPVFEKKNEAFSAECLRVQMALDAVAMDATAQTATDFDPLCTEAYWFSLYKLSEPNDDHSLRSTTKISLNEMAVKMQQPATGWKGRNTDLKKWIWKKFDGMVCTGNYDSPIRECKGGISGIYYYGFERLY